MGEMCAHYLLQMPPDLTIKSVSKFFSVYYWNHIQSLVQSLGHSYKVVMMLNTLMLGMYRCRSIIS
jgi:hypothetical protein